jgi:hypothetical protein
MNSHYFTIRLFSTSVEQFSEKWLLVYFSWDPDVLLCCNFSHSSNSSFHGAQNFQGHNLHGSLAKFL